MPDPDERAYVGLRLGRLLGVAVGDSRGPLGREELFAGWRLFFERLAAQLPVVLVVEDAQYADGGLLDFLDYLIDWVRDLPVYVLVFARSELGETRPRFGAGRNRTALTLDPLDAASMDLLVEALVLGMPAPARAKITAQAQGIPLFAVETVRSLIDRDIVQPVEGSYRLLGEVGELAVPDGLHALLAARLDVLDPGVRRLVADAAVLGTTFPAEALIAISGQDETVVRAALAELVRREVLSVSADPLSPEKGSYGFAQDMLRQVAYDTLSRRDRKARHLAVAAHLRAAFPGDGEEVTEVVARHYLDALDALPTDPDAGQIRAQAVVALTRAAERAKRTGAPTQAATSYATAAQLTQADAADGQQAAAAAFWEHAAGAALTNADWATATEQAGRAGELYRQGGDTRSAARAQAIAGEALRRWGRHAQAREQLTTALAVLREDPDAEAELNQAIEGDGLADVEHLACDRAWFMALRGDTSTAEAILAGLADLRASDDPQGQANIAVAEAFTAAARRQPASALRHARTALDHAVVLGMSHEYRRWAWPLAARAAHDLADTTTEAELLAMLDRYRPGQLAPMERAERDLARARLAAADTGPAAGAAFAAGIAGLRQHSTPYHLAHGLLDHADYLTRLGDDEAAEEAIAEARDIAGRLCCQPLLDRPDAIQLTSPRTAAS